MNGNSCCPLDKIPLTHTEKKDLLLDGCLSDLLTNQIISDATKICPYEMYRRSLQFDQFMHNASYIIENTDITMSDIFNERHIRHSEHGNTSLLELSVLQNDVQLFMIILESANPSVQQLDQGDDSLLHIAVQHGRESIADILCEYTVDDPNVFNVFKKNKDGASILDTIHLYTTSENMKRIINDYVAEHIFKTTI